MTIQDNEYVRMLKELKELVCGGVPDATQRHSLCPPNTDKSIRLAADGRSIVLGKALGIRLEGDPFQIIVNIWETP